MHELSAVCCDLDPDSDTQRASILDLLRGGANVNETDKNGVTPLHHAVRFRSFAAVRTLLEHGANVNQRCKRSGSTPLHRAVTSTGAPGTAGRTEEARRIIEILLASGADPEIENTRGRKAIEYVSDPTIAALLKPQSHCIRAE